MPTAYNRAANSATSSLVINRGRTSLSQIIVSPCYYTDVDAAITNTAPTNFLTAGVRVGMEIMGPDILPGTLVDSIFSSHSLTPNQLPVGDHSLGAALIFDRVRETVILDWVSASFTQNAGTAAKDIAISISAINSIGDTIWNDFIIGGKVLSSAVSKKDGIFLRFPQGLPTGLFGVTASTTVTATMDQASAGSFDLAVGYHGI